METAFKHSAKVPRRYKTTAKFIQNQTEKGVSLKTQIYNAKHEVLKQHHINFFPVFHEFSSVRIQFCSHLRNFLNN